LITSITIIGVCGGGAAYLDIQSKRGKLYDEQTALKSSQASLAKRRNELESSQHAVDEIQEKGRRTESLEEQKRVLTSDIATMEDAMAATRTDLANAVRETRAKAGGTTRAELQLADGQVLKNVRFVSVSNSEISVAHDGGMVRLPAKNLPRDLQDRFRFGTVPSDTPPPAVTPAPYAASAPPASAAPAPGPPALSSAEKAQRIQTLNTSLVALRARLTGIEGQARDDGLKEERKNSREQRNSNQMTQSNGPQTARQLERADKKKTAGDAAKKAFEKARGEEMDNLRLRIFQVEAEIYKLNNGTP
jgi:hypothetical protein